MADRAPVVATRDLGFPEYSELTREREVELAWMMGRTAHSTHRNFSRNLLAEAQNWRCCYCGVRMHGEARRRDPGAPTFEHVIPRSRGGTNHYDNLVVACLRCNETRGNKRIRGYDHG